MFSRWENLKVSTFYFFLAFIQPTWNFFFHFHIFSYPIWKTSPILLLFQLSLVIKENQPHTSCFFNVVLVNPNLVHLYQRFIFFFIHCLFSLRHRVNYIIRWTNGFQKLKLIRIYQLNPPNLLIIILGFPIWPIEP